MLALLEGVDYVDDDEDDVDYNPNNATDEHVRTNGGMPEENDDFMDVEVIEMVQTDVQRDEGDMHTADGSKRKCRAPVDENGKVIVILENGVFVDYEVGRKAVDILRHGIIGMLFQTMPKMACG